MTPSSSSIRRHLVASALVLACFAGCAAAAVRVQLSDAIVAQGSVVVDSFVKKVQHPSGGVVAAILVKDGDRVRAGDTLLRLDDTVARANLGTVVDEWDELTAARARAEAERDGLVAIAFPPSLLAKRNDPKVARILASAAKQFDVYRQACAGQKAQLRERLTQFRKQIEGLDQQIEAKKREIALVQIELTGAQVLWARNLVQLSRVVALQRDDAKARGDYGQLVSSRGETGAKIAETELQIIQVDEEARKEDEKELAQFRLRSAELVGRRITAEDQLDRLAIRAPQDGTVQELSVHTLGGVVAPQSEAIMLIVPGSDRLLVEAKVQTQDIVQLKVGQRVQVRVSGVNQRTTPELEGTVAAVSADSIPDPKTGASYYKLRITLKDGRERASGLDLVPGLPVEVFIETSAPRSILSYLVKPLSDQMVRAFR